MLDNYTTTHGRIHNHDRANLEVIYLDLAWVLIIDQYVIEILQKMFSESSELFLEELYYLP